MDYSKIRVGVKSLDDAVLLLGGDIKKANDRLADKNFVLRALQTNDLKALYEISNYFFKVSGIYSRLCRYMAYLYRYDWMVTPHIQMEKRDDQKVRDKAVKSFHDVLTFLDNFQIKRFFGEVALKVIRNGCYYGYLIRQNGKQAQVQELPPLYCRTRYSVDEFPAIEFNMKYFDEAFRDIDYRMRVLKLFPPEFKKGYMLYKQNKLKGDYAGDTNGWYLLEIGSAIKFNIGDTDIPLMIAVIPALIDLDNAQDLDRERMKQQLLKLIIQKFPLDKNGDPIFDMDEMTEMHRNAVQMVGRAIGVDVFSTFGDVDVEDIADSKASTAATDDLERIERNVFNQAGISQMQFNTDGNIALEKSILNDEATMYNLILKFENFLNYLIKPMNNNKNYSFRVGILTTTIYNFKEMTKLYKEQTQLGYSKMLPQIAVGQSQSQVLDSAYFENEVLDLVNVFIPPVSSNVMNSDILKKAGNGDGKSDTGGRPEKPDDEKTEKTIKNKEAQG